ncbi:MAG: HEAT repeat domain-containing protein [Bryobacterales bacterium]|nr:HEAT repeat domain-containing protein [Bryobacterales bacterium]
MSDLILSRSVLDRTTAATLLKIFMKCDTGVAQSLFKRTLTAPEGNGTDAIVLELLATMDEAGVGPHLGAALVQLLRSCDDKVRSKVALVLGHSRFNIGWALQHTDRRVRANAVEGLWKIDSPGARRMLYQALMDSDNRVRGNAIYGLLLLNERSALAHLRRMATGTYAKDRATAAWVIGGLGWPELMADLSVLLVDKDAAVVRQATRALEQIRGGASESVANSVDKNRMAV